MEPTTITKLHFDRTEYRILREGLHSTANCQSGLSNGILSALDDRYTLLPAAFEHLIRNNKIVVDELATHELGFVITVG